MNSEQSSVNSEQLSVSSSRSKWLLLTDNCLLITVLLVSLIERLALWLTYHPVSYGDTPSYRRLAEAIRAGTLYDGTRTPAYPLLMALLRSDRCIWLAQMGMGILITLLLFYIGRQVSGRTRFGVALALAHTFNLGQLFFEANILTETMTTFWIMLSLAGVALWLYRPRARSVFLAFGIGCASVFACLTRPLFIYLPFWLCFFLLLSVVNARRQVGEAAGENGRRRFNVIFRVCALYAASLLLPVVVIIGLWVNFIHSRFGEWNLSAMSGYHMMQHTGEFFEYVPDEYAALRDTYLKYRDAQVALRGTQTNVIWEAIPEMQQVSGLGFYELSRKLGSISTQLILHHPDLYLRNVVEGWWMFWRAPVYWSPEAFRWGWLATLCRPLILAERAVLFACNLLFIGASLFAGIAWVSRRRDKGGMGQQLYSLFYACLAGTIWIASILQTLLDHGDNPRFLVPLQSLVVLWVLGFVVEFITRRKKEKTAL